MTKTVSWDKPADEIDPVTQAFPASLDGLLPSYKEVPEDLKDHHHPACEFVSQLFFKGGSLKDLKFKDGIDSKKAAIHLRTVLGSFEPKHEHKIAGAAYLLTLWTDSFNEG